VKTFSYQTNRKWPKLEYKYPSPVLCSFSIGCCESFSEGRVKIEQSRPRLAGRVHHCQEHKIRGNR